MIVTIMGYFFLSFTSILGKSKQQNRLMVLHDRGQQEKLSLTISNHWIRISPFSTFFCSFFSIQRNPSTRLVSLTSGPTKVQVYYVISIIIFIKLIISKLFLSPLRLYMLDLVCILVTSDTIITNLLNLADFRLRPK